MKINPQLIEALCESKSAAFEAGMVAGRLDLDEYTKARLAEMEARCESYRVALGEIVKWNSLPWADMDDDDAHQLRDVKHALDMVSKRAHKALIK